LACTHLPLISMGRGLASQLRKDAGTRSIVEVTAMFIFFPACFYGPALQRGWRQ
jgi:hypothetical protein